MTQTDITTTNTTADVIDALDSFYCDNVVTALWADAVINRLGGQTIFLLGDELAKIADRARGGAHSLAGRIGYLDLPKRGLSHTRPLPVEGGSPI
jgi:hypothetical protein